MNSGPSGDINPEETKEWMESFENILAVDGVERASFLLKELAARMRVIVKSGVQDLNQAAT